jgi:catalase-peroxidase
MAAGRQPEDTLAPAAHTPGKRVPTMMSTADMALKVDPGYRAIMEKFRADPDYFRRRLGARLVQAQPPRHGAEGPLPRAGSAGRGPDLAGPIPKADYAPISENDVAELRCHRERAGCRVQDLVKTAWASASTYRQSDHRGGANGARIRFEPQRSWEVNEPENLPASSASMKVSRLSSTPRRRRRAEGVDRRSDRARRLCRPSSRPLRLLVHAVEVPFTPGRTDALEEMTDAESFTVLELGRTASATTCRCRSTCRRRNCSSTARSCSACPRRR